MQIDAGRLEADTEGRIVWNGGITYWMTTERAQKWSAQAKQAMSLEKPFPLPNSRKLFIYNEISLCHG